jgi:uncharacterized membrane protein
MFRKDKDIQRLMWLQADLERQYLAIFGLFVMYLS